MNVSKVSARLIAAGLLSCALGSAHATFTFATLAGSGNAAGNATTYAASVNGSIDTFSNLTINSDLGVASLARSTAGATGIGYTVFTESDLYSVQTSGIGGSALTVANNTDTLTFGSFTSSILNFGVQLFLTDLSPGAVGGGVMQVLARDTAGASQSFTFTQSSFSSNTGQFLPLMLTLSSTTPLASVKFTPPAVGSNPNVFATADNLVLAAVPEASTWMTMLVGGAAVLGGVARRRRA